MKVRITFQSPLTTIGEKGAGCVELLLGTILKGDKGDPGRDGNDGAPDQDGAPGKSAYEYAKEQGFSGTEEQFSQALAGVFLHENIGETDEVTI
jgi:hypothetical protein